MARVLVVDDDQINCELLATWLGKKGHEAVTAESGEQALARLGAEAFDLVFLDISMPGMNGIETLERLRQQFPHDQLPVLMVSARPVTAKRTVVRKSA